MRRNSPFVEIGCSRCWTRRARVGPQGSPAGPRRSLGTRKTCNRFSNSILRIGRGTGLDEPDPGWEESDSGLEEPDTGLEEPDTGLDEPNSGLDEPDPDLEEPDSDLDESDTGLEESDRGRTRRGSGREESDTPGK